MTVWPRFVRAMLVIVCKKGLLSIGIERCDSVQNAEIYWYTFSFSSIHGIVNTKRSVISHVTTEPSPCHLVMNGFIERSKDP